MKKKKLNVFAIDLGGSSGRGTLGSFDGERLQIDAVGRFANIPVNLGVAGYWDFPRIFNDVIDLIRKAQSQACVASMGVDTYGGCMCMIDRDGRLLENPQYHRDPNIEKYLAKAKPLLPLETLNEAAGYNMSTEYRQLLKLKYITAFRPDFAAAIDKILFLPSAINYYLSGAAYCEFSSSVCVQWSYYDRPEWNMPVLELAGVQRSQMPGIVRSGTILGSFTDTMCSAHSLKPAKVIAVTEHDSGSAMNLLTARKSGCVYVSQGTMSVLSVPVERPVLTDTAIAEHFGNELSHDTLRLTRNHTGLFLIQQCRAFWEKQSLNTDYAFLESEAAKAPAMANVFDVDDGDLKIPGDTPGLISQKCGKKLSQGETVRAIYDSLSLAYAKTIAAFRRETKQEYALIRALGGGCKSPVLCQCIANATGLPVEAGPDEGTSTGNLCVQLIALGEIASMEEADCITQSPETRSFYLPKS